MDFSKYLEIVRRARGLIADLPPDVQQAGLDMLSEGLQGNVSGVQYHAGELLMLTSGHRHPVGAAGARDEGGAASPSSPVVAAKWDEVEARCGELAGGDAADDPPGGGDGVETGGDTAKAPKGKAKAGKAAPKGKAKGKAAAHDDEAAPADGPEGVGAPVGGFMEFVPLILTVLDFIAKRRQSR